MRRRLASSCTGPHGRHAIVQARHGSRRHSAATESDRVMDYLGQVYGIDAAVAASALALAGRGGAGRECILLP